MNASFEAVYADPLSDAPRERLADALREKGDPRGELIALQLSRHRGGKLSREQSARENALLKAHGKAWLASLENVIVPTNVKWERGFPAVAHLNFGSKRKGPLSAERLAQVPELATLRSLDMTSPNLLLRDEDANAIAALPALRWLEELNGLAPAGLAELARLDPPSHLTRIVVRYAGGGGLAGQRVEAEQRRAIDAAFATGTGLPALRHLELFWSHGANRPEDYAWLSKSEIGRRLVILRADQPYLDKTLPAWHAVLEANEALALEELRVTSSYGAVLTLARTADGWTRLTGQIVRPKVGADVTKVAMGMLDGVLAQLGGKLTDVRIDGYTRE